MTSTPNITLQLQPHFERGLELWLENGLLRFKAPKETLTPELMALLKQNKPAILAWLTAEQPAVAAQVVDEYPLAFTQGAIWMLYRFAPHSPAYNTTFACVLGEAVNETAVRQAFHALLIRHPVLRSTFADTDQGPRQRVWDHLPTPLQFVDGTGWSETQLDTWLQQEADAPFDLQNQPCLRVKLVRNSVRGDLLIATIQHVGADLWALLIVARDIREFYQRAVRGEVLSLEPLAVTYRQHVEWQQQFMVSERGKKERRFWQRALQGAPMQISLPADFPRPPVLQLKSAVQVQTWHADEYQAIRDYCKQRGITPFVFMQCAFQWLVHARTGAPDFLIGTPTMGRSRKGMDQVVGDFANPVVVRACIPPDSTLEQCLYHTRRTVLAAMEHQEYPFPAVVQDCNPPRDSSRTPLFQLMFVWHQGNADALLQDDWIKTVLPLSGPRGAPYDLMLAVSDLGQQFELKWTWQTHLYRPETIAQLGTQLHRIVQHCLQGNPQQTVAELLAPFAPLPHRARRDVEAEMQVRDHLPPSLQPHFCVLEQRPDVSADKPWRRLCIASTDAAQRFDWQQRHAAEFPGMDEVLVLPQLPRTAGGDIDLERLALHPRVDASGLHQVWAAAGQQENDLRVLRRLHHCPTWEADELVAPATPTATAPLRRLDISTRPWAWAVGEPLPPHAIDSTHLFAALQKTAQRFPARGLILLDDAGRETHYRYPALVDDAHIAAAGFQRAGLQAGAIVLLQMRFDSRFFAVWWGAVLAGLRPLNVATPEQYSDRNGVAQKLYNVAHNFETLTVVADRTRVDATHTWLGTSKPVLDADTLLEHGERFEWETLSTDPVAFLQLTSGSTGTPKAIQITHQGILHHIAASALHNHYHSDDISLNWLPFDHVVPILTTHVKDCVLGIQQVQLTTASVLDDPLRWLKALSDYRVTYSWAPNFAYQRVVDALQHHDTVPALDLSCVTILMNAGEQVLAPVVQAFHAACAPFGLKPNAVQPAFGMAEACTCMTYNNASDRLLSVHFNNSLEPDVCDVGPADQASHGFVDLGDIVPGVEIRITNHRNELVREGVIGRLQIRGPVITPGYLNNPAANAEAFVGDGWFNSGDLGFLWNRRLILTGREKEMIVVRGANYYCFELEQVAAQVAGVLPTFVAATGVALHEGANSDALVLFYVSDGSEENTRLERQMAARVAEAFGVTAEYVIAVEPEHFYKTTSGKIQRGQFRKLFEKGFYAQAVTDWQRRHRGESVPAHTLFRLNGLPHTPALSVSTHTEVLCWPDIAPAQRSTHTRKALSRLRENAQAHLLLVLADLATVPGPSTGMQLQHCLHAAGECARLLAAAEWPVAQLTLAVRSESASALLLFKPLLETLRQETGLPLRGTVVNAAAQPLWPETESLRLCALNGNAAQKDPLVRNGTYWITGATGALAEPLCEWLLQKHARLLLTGRVALDQRPHLLRRVRQWQARFGADRLCYLMQDSVTALDIQIDDGLRALGSTQLDGIFHLAGHLDLKPLAMLDDQHWQSISAAKVQGSLALADLLQRRWPTALLVQYGSLNSHFGGQHAAAYSLASAAQVWLTEHLNQHTRLRCWCLNWSVWQGVGMASTFSAAELQMARNKGLLPLQQQRDFALVERLLACAPGNYYAGIDPAAPAVTADLDWYTGTQEQIQVHVQAPQATASLDMTRLRAHLEKNVKQDVPCIDAVRIQIRQWQTPWPRLASGALDPTPFLTVDDATEAAGVPAATDIEQQLCDIWSQVLARTVTDVSRSFFEYGGHSINATQLIAAINRQCASTLTVADLFQYPSVRALANRVQHHTDAGFFSLALQDCIARGNDFRLDRWNPGSSGTRNVVFLPTAAGIASACLPLLLPLQSQRLHVLSAPLTRAEDRDIENTAAHFIRLLDDAQLIAADTQLVGWSMGGVLGYEMLKQLARQGRPLPALVMLDSGFGVGLHPITFDPDFQWLMFAVELGLAPEKMAEFNQQNSPENKLTWLQQYLKTLDIEAGTTLLLEWGSAYRKRLHSLEQYQAGEGIPAADIRLIKAALHSHGRDDLGWAEAYNNIKVTSVQADHQSIVKQPAVAAELMRQKH